MFSRGIALALVALAVLSTTIVHAATTEVALLDTPKVFDPKNVSVQVGDKVHWSYEGSDAHNVRQNDKIFRSDAPSSVVDFTVTFSAGTFNYFCERHGSKTEGMRGVVAVPVKISAAPAGSAFTVIWAAAGTDSGSKFDVQFRIGSSAWKDLKSGSTAVKTVVKDPEAGKAYKFRARSIKGAAKSEWSPVRSFTP